MSNLVIDFERYMLPCLSKQLFGIDCPGCGAQRAFVMLTEGNFSGAFEMFPAIYTSILFFCLLTLHLTDKARNYEKAVIIAAILNASIIIIAYIYKMINL